MELFQQHKIDMDVKGVHSTGAHKLKDPTNKSKEFTKLKNKINSTSKTKTIHKNICNNV